MSIFLGLLLDSLGDIIMYFALLSLISNTILLGLFSNSSKLSIRVCLFLEKITRSSAYAQNWLGLLKIGPLCKIGSIAKCKAKLNNVADRPSLCRTPLLNRKVSPGPDLDEKRP
ncbi:hypothetical protein CEXT_460751 [Caerostris extrusa]|uniref:Uncharacterized protein n=1 Tax=Caerostris extrusa TaxID=172846 RepID=A0AAV4VTE3_CAEEX|nr:hypothetical protein CEXT_460751 [Caerostris extrusa]